MTIWHGNWIWKFDMYILYGNLAWGMLASDWGNAGQPKVIVNAARIPPRPARCPEALHPMSVGALRGSFEDVFRGCGLEQAGNENRSYGVPDRHKLCSYVLWKHGLEGNLAFEGAGSTEICVTDRSEHRKYCLCMCMICRNWVSQAPDRQK